MPYAWANSTKLYFKCYLQRTLHDDDDRMIETIELVVMNFVALIFFWQIGINRKLRKNFLFSV